MIRAIVTDLDDTLLRYDKTISTFTKKTLAACRDKGIKLLFATARGSSAKKLIPFELFDGWIMLNGAVAMQNGVITYERLIQPDIFCPFLKKMSELGMKATAEISGIHYSNFNVASKWEREFTLTDFSNISESSEKLYVIVDSPKQRGIVTKWLPNELYVHFTKDGLALIMHREATKFNAVSSVIGAWGIPFSDIVAFGDDTNDRDLLENCGIGVAMGNALQEIKAIADEICKDCDNDGVAAWLSDRIK